MRVLGAVLPPRERPKETPDSEFFFFGDALGSDATDAEKLLPHTIDVNAGGEWLTTDKYTTGGTHWPPFLAHFNRELPACNSFAAKGGKIFSLPGSCGAGKVA